MNEKEDIVEIFAALTAENKALLLEQARRCLMAENAADKAVAENAELTQKDEEV
jgi:hypothetical protein